jgi:FMN phosphatase YigB (HAD superfamily)
MSGAFGLGAALARLRRGRPLVIVDADEVLLRFAEGFDRFLRERELFLDFASYRLHGNVKRLDDRSAILDIKVTALLEEFRRDLDWLEPVEGARESLAALGESAGVIVLSNVTPEQAVSRAHNLVRLGFDFPLVANSGLKGLAVKHLANHASAPTLFIDDIPRHLASAAEHAPDVTRIHLVGDARLKPLLPPSPHANLYAEDWAAAALYIHSQLNKA